MSKESPQLVASVISTTATSDKEQNIERAFAFARAACERGADWVCLPEMFAFHGPYESLWEKAEFEDGPLNQRLSEFARKNRIVLFAGSVGERPETSTAGKIFNTQYVFGRDGGMIAKYRKVHLFNLLGTNGEPLYCESDGYLPGDRPVVCHVDGWRVGLATCYDLRFTEFFTRLSRSQPLDALVIPSAFTAQTGMYHWAVLLRARAIENLCFVLAPNQVGQHSPGKVSYGHGMIIDPWGTVIADTGKVEGQVTASLTADRIMACRAQLPALKNRRPDAYL